MEQYELGVAVALERIAALRREADDARSAKQVLWEAQGWARQARRDAAARALWASGIGLLLATIALVTG
jgi:hypothetical protein